MERTPKFEKFVDTYGEDDIMNHFLTTKKIQPQPNDDGCPLHYIKDKDGNCIPDFPEPL